MARNEIQVLMREPIIVVIGTESAPRRIEVREPTNAELGEYLALVNVALMKLLRDNAPLIRAAVEGKGVASVNFEAAAIADIVTQLVAKIVGENEDFVRHQMFPEQSVAIVRAFLDVLGWEFIRESFQQAATAWNRTAPQAKSESAERPSWPVESSPTSAGPSPH